MTPGRSSTLRYVIVVTLLVGTVGFAMAKTGRTYYTPERIAAAKQNIESYEWAQTQLETILEADFRQHQMLGEPYTGANRFVDKSDDALFDMVPPITIPRKREASTTLCPEHGADIRRYSGYNPWLLDFENHPYKVICPIGREVYPSNDFAAGDMTSGDFPDDGDGCMVGEERYQFIRYYAHAAYNNWITPGIHAMAMAYMLTDDARYGHKAAVLLAALAEQYPGPHFNSEYCYDGPYGYRSGMVTDYIWENIKLVDLARAYDAIWPIYDEDPQLLEYLRQRGCIDQTVPNAADGARKFVEDRIMRQAMQALMDVAIQGNPGHHQLAALTIGLVMDDHTDASPNTRDVVWNAYHRGYAPAAWIFSNFLTRDGGGYEGPGYDKIKFNYVAIGKLMERLRGLHPDIYDEQEFPRILEDPKAQQMYEFFMDTTSLAFFTPEVGDAGGERLRPGIIPRRYYTPVPVEYVDGFGLYGDPRYATALLGLQSQMPRVDLFEPSIEQQARDAAALPEAAIVSQTRVLDHYGFTYLSAGEPGPYEREACINYTALRGHGQHDYLSLYLYAHEMSHLPDLGYPYSWEYRWQWDSNIYGHNTVAVDGCSPLAPHEARVGWVSLIGDRQGVQVAAVAQEPYRYDAQLHPNQPPVSRYERICVMVEEDEQESYLLDLFVVEGGLRHDQSWHSVLRTPTLPELDWAEQPEGTAAGPDVPFDGKYVNSRGQEAQDALCYVTGVKRAQLPHHATFDWDYELEEPAGLRLHLVPVDGPRELIYGTGRSPARPEDWALPFVFVRNEGQEGLATRFLTVLEPYRGSETPRIQSVTATGQWPLVVTVERGDATDEISIYAPSADQGITRGGERNIGVTVRTVSAEQQTRHVAFGWSPDGEQESVRRQLIAFNRDDNTVTVSGGMPEGETPRHVRIFNSGRSSVYSVLEAVPAGDGATLLRLKETSLLGRGIPVGYEDGRINNDVCLPFPTGRVDEQGNLLDFPCRFTGARVENADASASLLLRGANGAGWITGESDYNLYLEEPVSAQQLRDLFGEPQARTQFSIYDYGIGDRCEMMDARDLP